MQVTITIPIPSMALRRWKWALLGLLAFSIIFTGGGGNTARAAFPGSNGTLAFHSDRTGNYEVYTMNADGSAQTNISNNAALDVLAAWSPDGTKIAFESNRTGNYEIFSMNADGSGQTNLTNNAGFDSAAAWSGDGTMIAFQSDRDTGTSAYEIYSMRSRRCRRGSYGTRSSCRRVTSLDSDHPRCCW